MREPVQPSSGSRVTALATATSPHRPTRSASSKLLPFGTAIYGRYEGLGRLADSAERTVCSPGYPVGYAPAPRPYSIRVTESALFGTPKSEIVEKVLPFVTAMSGDYGTPTQATPGGVPDRIASTAAYKLVATSY